MDLLFENNHFKITALGNQQSSNLFLCFTGIGHGLGAIQKEEFVGSTSRTDAFSIYVTDKKRSWYNHVNPGAITREVAKFPNVRKIITVGNSMGGFGAIWITRYLRVHTCLAFVPQFSVHSDILPGEDRWMRFRSRIRHWRVPSLDGYFNDETIYYTFNGEAEKMHWERFARKDNTHHIVFGGRAHDISVYLKSEGLLSDIINLAFTEGDITSLLETRCDVRRLPAAAAVHPGLEAVA